MKRGTIPIGHEYELEFRYFDKDPTFKYFNRKFEIYLLEKKTMRRNYLLHMDNCDVSNWAPHLHKAPKVDTKLSFGVTTLNWTDIKKNFLECIVGEIGEPYRDHAKKAVNKLASPKT